MAYACNGSLIYELSRLLIKQEDNKFMESLFKYEASSERTKPSKKPWTPPKPSNVVMGQSVGQLLVYPSKQNFPFLGKC